MCSCVLFVKRIEPQFSHKKAITIVSEVLQKLSNYLKRFYANPNIAAGVCVFALSNGWVCCNTRSPFILVFDDFYILWFFSPRGVELISLSRYKFPDICSI